jgi:exopolyphosphatase/guanosine-5'-triphosphate,3'-diphosphate pyrophosphatase
MSTLTEVASLAARPGGATSALPGPGARLAALDLGTNNCRLLIATPDGAGFRVVDSFSRIVRLGEGLALTDRLGEAAMDRTVAALRVCRHLMDRHRVTHARCVATEACRRAANGAEFMRRVERQARVRLELLPQQEEARLAMLGCLPLVEPDADRLIMVDIGGGSTEIMRLDRWEGARGGGKRLGHAVSMPLGVVTLSETFGGQEEAGPEAYAAMVEHAHARLLEAGAVPGGAGEGDGSSSGPRVQMLGTSGTVTTLAAVHLGLRRYDRRKVDGIRLSFRAVHEVAAGLRALSNAERAAHPCIGAGRSDLVVAGCAILDAVHRMWPVEELRVADRGLREGILGELMGASLDQVLLPAAAAAAAPRAAG